MKKIVIALTAGIMFTGATFAQQKLDAQGHRGGMALMPENTIQSMLNGVKLGLRTLELDVVVSSDGQAVVSHDAYMSSVFMRKPDGSDITKAEEANLILYKMTYDDIRRYDSGTKPHPGFPEQAKIKTYKPLLSDLIDSVEAYTQKNHLKPVYYNIETKISPIGDGVYNPAPEEYLKIMMGVLNKKNISKRLIIQSFDVRTLQILHKTQPEIKLSLLAFGKSDVIANFQKQGLLSATDSKLA
ncbi:MAG TPA: glycerophosphodiester phosphodiesterase family protein, partial [Mucilaginibacter sp.]